MRMHEILGVEPMQVNTYRDGDEQFHFYVDHNGKPRSLSENSLLAHQVCLLVNHSDQIIRKPKLSAEQIKVLKLLSKNPDFRYLKKDKNAEVYTVYNYPCMIMPVGSCFYESDGKPTYFADVFRGLFSETDPEPIDIVKVLWDAGVKV